MKAPLLVLRPHTDGTLRCSPKRWQVNVPISPEDVRSARATEITAQF